MSLLCGYLTPSKGSLNGRLRNFSPQQETAPLPYKSANNGLWSNNNTWAQPVVWYTQIAPYLELRLTGILSRYQTISTLEIRTLPY
jgi:hypothetical protein